MIQPCPYCQEGHLTVVPFHDGSLGPDGAFLPGPVDQGPAELFECPVCHGARVVDLPGAEASGADAPPARAPSA